MKNVQELHILVKENASYLETLKEKLEALPLKRLEPLFIKTSNEVWSCSDCLACANCCKTISPIVEFDDIYSMAKHLKMEAGAFIEQFLEMDEEGDFVFRSQPCPMLNLKDNKCKVYESRPKACRQYPHLDEVNSKHMIDLAIENANYCGVVWDTLYKLDTSN